MRNKTPLKPSASESQYTLQPSEVPATQGMLQLVRGELKADNSELRAEMKAGFSQMESRFNQMESKFGQIDSRFSQIDAKFSHIDSRFNQMDARFNQVDAKLERVLSEVSRIAVLSEEQNSRNRIVMEGLTGLWQRQERVETRMDDTERFTRGLGRGRSPKSPLKT